MTWELSVRDLASAPPSGTQLVNGAWMIQTHEGAAWCVFSGGAPPGHLAGESHCGLVEMSVDEA